MGEHTERYPFCRVTYWDGNSAATADEAWTRCDVTPFGTYTYGEHSFENSSAGISARDKLIRFLEKAYEAGRDDAKREIRAILGVKESR